MSFKLNMPDAQEVIDSYGLGSGGKVQMFYTNELLRIADPYAPFRTFGSIRNGATIENGGTEIVYTAPYATRLWYGDNFNFTGAPLRGSRWLQRAYDDNIDSLVESLETFIKKGR